MDPDCMLSADYGGCYYVSPAYVGSRHTGSHSRDNSSNNSCVVTSSGGCSHDDRGRLAALISKFNTNNHGLVMTLVLRYFTTLFN